MMVYYSIGRSVTLRRRTKSEGIGRQVRDSKTKDGKK